MIEVPKIIPKLGAKRVEKIGDATLYLGDCLEIASRLRNVDCVVSDPPYGMKWDTVTKRFSGGSEATRAKRSKGKTERRDIVGDDKPFDPTPWITYPECVLFGANHFADKLPRGTTLVWIKRNDAAFGTFLSDAEIAWRKGGHGVYCRRDLSMAALALKRVHPTQKPVSIMEWVIGRAGKAPVVLDPYMGSGSTGIAALNLGRKFIGIEREPHYFDVACERFNQWRNERC
jgi:site-specific DNA-methyltransferase (adenine-specific)